jgi:hypothetical protein
MKKAIQVLNELEGCGVIQRYVIAGGVAALFYMEPVLTFDLDVFCILKVQEGNLVVLSPVYDALKERGYAMKAEHVVIEGVPVQFIPAYNALVEEAVAEAVEVQYEGEKTRWIRAGPRIASGPPCSWTRQMWICRFLKQSSVGTAWKRSGGVLRRRRRRMNSRDGAGWVGVEEMARAKRERRRLMARLSFEEKIRILVKLQKIAASVGAAVGRSTRPVWKI